jgi:DegV family protein with EDD domain
VEKIKIITDSTSDLPKHIIEQYDIEVLPLLVNFGSESYIDGVDIKLDEMLKRIDEGDVFPTTSQVNPQRFQECYEKYIKEGYKILSIHISSKMSGTYQSACIAKDLLETEDIQVIDSLNVTAGLGLLVLKACMLRDQGAEFLNIKEEIIRAIPHVRSALAFNSLENLVKGGRLSKAAGIIGNILGIKPILAVKEGELAVADKVRGSKKAVKNILDFIENTGARNNEPIFLVYSDNEDILYNLRESLREKDSKTVECEVGCVVGVHAGRNVCGVFFLENY